MRELGLRAHQRFGGVRHHARRRALPGARGTGGPRPRARRRRSPSARHRQPRCRGRCKVFGARGPFPADEGSQLPGCGLQDEGTPPPSLVQGTPVFRERVIDPGRGGCQRRCNYMRNNWPPAKIFFKPTILGILEPRKLAPTHIRGEPRWGLVMLGGGGGVMAGTLGEWWLEPWGGSPPA